MDTPRYSRHRSIPVTNRYIHSGLRLKRRREDKDTAKIAKKANGASELKGGADELEGANGVPSSLAKRTAGRRTRWFAKGPVHIDQAVRAASKGGYAVAVWLAVRARMDTANGAPATTAWLVKVTGLGQRTVQKAAAALVDIGMLKRDGGSVFLPSYMQEE